MDDTDVKDRVFQAVKAGCHAHLYPFVDPELCGGEFQMLSVYHVYTLVASAIISTLRSN